MKRIGAVLLVPMMATGLFTAAMGCANVDGEVGVDTQRKVTPPEAPVLCRLTGGGQVDTGENLDSFGGNAQPFRSGVDGEWNHVTHDGGHFHGDPDFIECYNVGGPEAAPPAAPANAIFFSGLGEYNDEEDCRFGVWIEDHSEPGVDDVYMIDISCQSGVSYSTSGWIIEHGNLQIHAVPPGFIPR